MSDNVDFQELQEYIRSKRLTKEQIRSLQATLQVMELHSDKPSKKTYLPKEERDLLDKCSSNRNGEKRVCPKCGSISIIEYGSRKGRQRHYCKDCKKTFGDTFGTVFFRSKLSIEKWKKLIEMVLMGASVREISRDLGVSTNTALHNRYRICSVLLQLVNNTDSFPSIAEGGRILSATLIQGCKEIRFLY